MSPCESLRTCVAAELADLLQEALCVCAAVCVLVPLYSPSPAVCLGYRPSSHTAVIRGLLCCVYCPLREINLSYMYDLVAPPALA